MIINPSIDKVVLPAAGVVMGVVGLHPITYALVPVVLLGVTVLATWLPARRGIRADPLRALRAE